MRWDTELLPLLELRNCLPVQLGCPELFGIRYHIKSELLRRRCYYYSNLKAADCMTEETMNGRGRRSFVPGTKTLLVMSILPSTNTGVCTLVVTEANNLLGA